MKEEIMRVLKMVEEGKIDADKGAQLIEAINNNKEKEEKIKIDKNELKDSIMMELNEAKEEIENDLTLDPHIKESIKTSLDKQIEDAKIPVVIKEDKFDKQKSFLGEKMLKVKVLSSDGDKVNVTLPIKFVKGMIKACGKIPNVNVEGMEGVDANEMTETVMSAIDSDIVGKIVDIQSGDGDIVEIIIE